MSEINVAAPRRPWLPDVLTRVALSTGIGYVAAAYTVSRWLTRPSRGQPRRLPEELGLRAERLECLTADRIRLIGWEVSPARPRATIALFHGLRQSRGHLLERCALLADAGYRCVAFDHRAHGESGGKRSSFGYHEARDVAAVLELVRQRWPNEPRGALGISMGAAALCFAAAQVRSCQAVILESCYHDVTSAFEHRLQHNYPPWYRRLARGVIWVTERRLGLRLEQVTPAHHVGDLAPAPVLVLSGTDDPLATPEETSRLYERCRGSKELWLVPRASHRDVFEMGGEAYRERVLGFLERSLADGATQPHASRAAA